VGSGNLVVLATVVGTAGTLIGAAAGVITVVQARQKATTPRPAVDPDPADGDQQTEPSSTWSFLVVPPARAPRLTASFVASLAALCLGLYGWLLIIVIGGGNNSPYAVLHAIILAPSLLIFLKTTSSQVRHIIWADHIGSFEYPYILATFAVLILVIVTDVTASGLIEFLTATS
jgi:hypothetical protein